MRKKKNEEVIISHETKFNCHVPFIPLPGPAAAAHPPRLLLTKLQKVVKSPELDICPNVHSTELEHKLEV